MLAVRAIGSSVVSGGSTSGALPLPQVPSRGLRKGKAPKKPKIRLRVDLDGKVRVPDKIPGYGPAEIDKYAKWLDKTTEKVHQRTGGGGGDRFNRDMQSEIDAYVGIQWGIYQSERKAVVRGKRILNRKKRREKLLWKKMDQWNALEDMKEDRVLRNLARAEKELRKESFSFRRFLAEKREAKRPAYTIESEEDFLQTLEDDRKNFLVYAPKSVRRQYNKRNVLGYQRILEREVVDPFLHEVRRKARMAELVGRREDAIAQETYRRQLAEKRAIALEKKQKEHLKKQAHWNEVVGGWQRENSYLRTLRRKFVEMNMAQESEARKEYLSALEEDISMWTDTPDSCRYARFRMVGTNHPFHGLPYRNAGYM
eukprot:TRINITY_DN5848_c0_g1_i1.p1 TRINITY_DN5848_c0_g1~~TRINITY_DN5848_c0_g1_i1.p1  ORF type:complete len:381 (+),score=102.84 TRINITY_DN5848_c0_g1_i1:37-1143(+)